MSIQSWGLGELPCLEEQGGENGGILLCAPLPVTVDKNVKQQTPPKSCEPVLIAHHQTLLVSRTKL